MNTEDNVVVAFDFDATVFVARLKMRKRLIRILMMLSSLWHIYHLQLLLLSTNGQLILIMILSTMKIPLYVKHIGALIGLENPSSITGVLYNSRAPTLAEFNLLFEWKQPGLDSLTLVSLLCFSVVDVPLPVSIAT